MPTCEPYLRPAPTLSQVALVIADSMKPPEKAKDALWGVEVLCSVVFCLEFCVRLVGTGSVRVRL